MDTPKRTDVRAVACMGCAFVLALLAAPAAADFKRITTKSEFLDLVVEREFTASETIVQYTEDGNMVGVARGMQIKGTWEWISDALCRKATLGSTDLGYNCLTVHADGDNMILVRDKGLGEAFLLRRAPAGHSSSEESVRPVRVSCFC